MTPATTPAIEARNLTFAYKNRKALSDATFQVMRGQIHGFVGPNGAGKTTTLKILSTLLPPKQGSAKVFGFDVVKDYISVRRRIGFMPDSFSMYRQMTVYEYLDFFAAAYGLDSARRAKVIDDVLALTDMNGRRDDLVKGLSRGMQQRVSLARVLVHDPELLLLDEPASGLDPRARIELMEILRELQRMGKTVFISSHILSELALLCDSVTILDRGEVRYTGPMSGLARRDAAWAEYTVLLAAEHPPCEESLRAIPGVAEVSRLEGEARYRVRFDRAQTKPGQLARTILDSGGELVSIQEDVRHLNQAFMELTESSISGPTERDSSPTPPALVSQEHEGP